MRLRWLEIEKGMSPWILLWSLIAWGIGIAVYLSYDWFLGVASFVLTMGLIYFTTQFIESLGISAAAKIDANEAVAAFESAYPGDQITSVALRAVEEERYVYSMRYRSPGQISFPEPRRYFAVARTTGKNVIELDTMEWWPRGLK
jgi:hypothetical protein